MAQPMKPDATPGAAYWSALDGGALTFQRCRRCRRAWLPAREDCVSCWSPEWDWQTASGRGRIVSYVVFHTAFHEAFKDRVPYNVAVVELDEGPRLVTNIVGVDATATIPLDSPVSLVIERDHGRALPRFRLAGAADAAPAT